MLVDIFSLLNKTLYLISVNVGLPPDRKSHQCTTCSHLGRTFDPDQFCAVASCCHGASNRLGGTYPHLADNQYADREPQDNCVSVLARTTAGYPSGCRMFRYIRCLQCKPQRNHRNHISACGPELKKPCRFSHSALSLMAKIYM